MPDIVRSPNHVDPARVITEAINAAQLRGLDIWTRPGLGVVCRSTAEPVWEKESAAEAVSALGAVLLHLQPKIPNADRALMEALQVNGAWIFGFEDGVGRLAENARLKKAPCAQLYNAGRLLGIETRALISTVVCEPHGVRYPRGGRCGKCAAGIPAPRLDDEPTLRNATDPKV